MKKEKRGRRSPTIPMRFYKGEPKFVVYRRICFDVHLTGAIYVLIRWRSLIQGHVLQHVPVVLLSRSSLERR